jgi:zinc transport system substrate-binding protein
MLRSLTTLIPLVLVASLSGCGGDAAGGDGDGKVRVAAGFYALEYVAERIGGDEVEVVSLTKPGQDPHDAELSVAQTAELAEADVVVHLSDFQPVVDDAVEQVVEGTVVDARDAGDLTATGSQHTHADGEHEEDGHEEDGHEEDGHEEDHDGEEDPHFWLDPARLAAVGADVTEALSEADPAGAKVYRANLRKLERDLTALDDELEQGLAECRRRVVIVSHDAFGYLALRYDLDVHAIAGLSPDSEPSPAHLRELHDLIEAEGVTTVFSERLASPAMAQTLSGDLGLSTGVLDPLEGLSDETRSEDYVSLMRQNLSELREANECR